MVGHASLATRSAKNQQAKRTESIESMSSDRNDQQSDQSFIAASAMTTYRWNTTDFASGYDAAAEIVHPRYLEVQDEILRLLQLAEDKAAVVVDLGGGSGKLMERV